jgi:hypothetical protein
MQGFINQFLSALAPAVTATAQILMEFFTSTNENFSYAQFLADAFTLALKGLVIVGSVLVGSFQMLRGVLLGIGAAGTVAFGVLTEAIGESLKFLGKIIPGLAEVGSAVAKFGVDTQQFGDALADKAEISFMQGVRNFENPLQGFDEKMRQAQENARNSVVPPVQEAAEVAGQTIASAITASSKELKAIVLGTAEGESFRNTLMRGGDPRADIKEESRRTADATERTADAVEDLAAAGGPGGFGLAAITV